MRCPFCSFEDSRVVDSRSVENGASIRRRRECPQCNRRFTTYEKYEETPLVVNKKDGRRELFDSSKLFNGLLKAFEKRPVSGSDQPGNRRAGNGASGKDGSNRLCPFCFCVSAVCRCAELHAGTAADHGQQ